jgi:hypothetical protein
VTVVLYTAFVLSIIAIVGVLVLIAGFCYLHHLIRDVRLHQQQLLLPPPPPSIAVPAVKQKPCLPVIILSDVSDKKMLASLSSIGDSTA